MKIVQRIVFFLALCSALLATAVAMLYYAYLQRFNTQGAFFDLIPIIADDIRGRLVEFYASYSDFERFLYAVTVVFIFVTVFSLVYFISNYLIHSKDISQKKLIQKAFSQYISPSVIHDILNRPESLVLGGKSAYLTVYFLDINDFSSLLTEYHPKKIVEYLNDYFSEMSEIILDNEGTVDKYQGDSIMAFWGAPKTQDEHAVLACKTALEHQQALAELRKKWKAQRRPEVFGKIGIASGDMIVGNIGSKGHFNYTVVGRAVNNGSELEKLNNIYETDILVSEKTYHKAKHDFEFREIDDVMLKGRKKTMRVFELLAKKGGLSNGKAELVAKYHEALEFFREKKYKEARKAINHCLRIASDDKASQLLKEKIAENIKKKSRKK